MNSWLKCSLESGMFPNEYAVEVDTLECGKISLFAPDYKVRSDDKLVSVDVVSENDAGVLVRLPNYPFEVSSRIVRVGRGDMVVTQ